MLARPGYLSHGSDRVWKGSKREVRGEGTGEGLGWMNGNDTSACVYVSVDDVNIIKRMMLMEVSTSPS